MTRFACRDLSNPCGYQGDVGSRGAHVQSTATRRPRPQAVRARDASHLPFRLSARPSSGTPWARGLLSAFWERGSPDLPACGLRRGSKEAQHSPSSSTQAQDPREGPSLAGRTTRSFLRHGLVRLAHEEAESSRRGTSQGAHDASHDDRGRQPAQCPSFLFGARGASAGESIKQRHPFRCNKTKTSPTAGRKSLWSPSRHHHQSL